MIALEASAHCYKNIQEETARGAQKDVPNGAEEVASLPEAPLPEAPLPEAPLPEAPLPEVPLPEAASGAL